jgi:hypothetical protein
MLVTFNNVVNSRCEKLPKFIRYVSIISVFSSVSPFQIKMLETYRRCNDLSSISLSYPERVRGR